MRNSPEFSSDSIVFNESSIVMALTLMLSVRVYPHRAAAAAAASSIIQCWSIVMLRNGSGTDFQV